MFDEIWILIPLAPFLLGAFAIWMRHNNKALDAMAAQKGPDMALVSQITAQNERLEQRVRVLERIITDRGFDLANQIEDLRDTPRPLN